MLFSGASATEISSRHNHAFKFVKSQTKLEPCFPSSENQIEREREKKYEWERGERRRNARPDWIRRGSVFLLHVNALLASGWIDSDGLPVGFHYVLCTSDQEKKKPASFYIPPPPSPPTEHSFLSERKVQNCSRKKSEKKKCQGQLFSMYFSNILLRLEVSPCMPFYFQVKPCHLPCGGYTGMLLQYKICTFLGSL